jgi:hypothetical protein
MKKNINTLNEIADLFEGSGDQETAQNLKAIITKMKGGN